MPNPLPRPILAACLLLSACGGQGGAPAARPVGMANPASVYCADLGGRLEMRQEQAGAAGYCHLPDGSVIEEWQLYRGKNSL